MKRFALWTSVLILVVVALLGTVYALRGTLLAPHLERFLVATAESQFGIQLSVGHIGGSYFTSFEITGVETVAPSATGPLVSVDLRHARIEYAPLSLLSGVDAFLARTAIEIEGVKLHLDLSRQTQALSEEPQGPTPIVLPGSLPRIRFRDSTIAVRGAGYQAAFDGVQLETGVAPNAPTPVRLRVANLRWDHPNLRRGETSLTADLGYSNEALVVERVTLGETRVVEAARVTLAGLPDTVSFASTLRAFGGSAELDGTLQGSVVQARWNIESLSLDEVFSLVVVPGITLHGRLETSGTLRFDAKQPADLHGQFTLVFEEGSFRGIGAERLALRAAAAAGALRVEELTLHAGKNALALRDVTAPANLVFAGDVDRLIGAVAGAFSLDLADIPALLEAAGLKHQPGEASIPPHRLVLEGGLRETTVWVAQGRLETDTGSVALQGEGAKVALPIAGRTLNEAPIQAALKVDLPDLASLAPLLPVPPLGGSLRADVDVDGTLGTPQGSAQVDAKKLVFRGIPVGDLALRARGDPRKAVLESLELSRGPDRLSAGGTVDVGAQVVEGGSLSVSVRELGAYQDLIPENVTIGGHPLRITGSLNGEISAEGSLAEPHGSVAIEAKGLVLQGHLLGDATVRGKADAGRFVIESLDLQRGNDHVSGRGAFDLATRELSDVSVSVSVRDLGAYQDLIPTDLEVGGKPVRVGGSLEGRFTVGGSLAEPQGSVEIEAAGLVFQDRPLGDAIVRGSADSRRIVLDRLDLRRGDDRISGRGTYDIQGRRLDRSSLRVSLHDVSANAKGFLSDDLQLAGRVAGEVEASGPLTEPEARVELTLADFRIKDIEVPAARLQANSSGRRVRVEKLEAKTSHGDISLAGSLTRGPSDANFDVQLDSLALARSGVALRLQAPTRLELSRSGIYKIDGLALGGDVGAIRIDGVAAPDGESDFTVAVSDLKGAGWLEELVGDRFVFEGLDAQFHLTGTLAKPRVAIVGTLERLLEKDTSLPTSGKFDLAYSEKGIRVDQFEWSGAGALQLAAAGFIPLDPLAVDRFLPGDLSFALQASIPKLEGLHSFVPPELAIEGSLQTDLKLTGTWDRLSGRIAVDARDVSLPSMIQPAPPGRFAIKTEVNAEGNEVSLARLEVVSDALSVEGTGRWSGAPSLAAVARGGELGLTGDVALHGRIALTDVSWAAKGVQGLKRVGGKLEADVRIEGPVREPAFHATLRLSDGEVRPDLAVPSLRALNLEAVVDARSVSLREARGELGGAPFQLSGNLNRGDATGPQVDLRLTGENLLLFRSEGVKLRADADLAVKGPVSRLEFTGDVAITDGRLVKKLNLLGMLGNLGNLGGPAKPKTEGGFQLFSIRDPPLQDAVFDLRISSKNPFLIKNDLARGTLRPELRLTGTGEIPVLLGNVYVDPIRVSLPAGRLTVQSGVIRFLESDPDRPQLDLVAGAQMMGYDITILVEGPYDEPVVTLSSVPPLPDEDLVLLVLTGQPPKSPADRTTGAAQSMNVAVYLGKGLLARWFGDESVESDESVLDRFDLEVGRGVTRTGEETLDAQFRLGRGVIRHGDTIYLTGEKDIYDDFNAGLKIVFRFK
jgi:translocation and assembly module TamB